MLPAIIFESFLQVQIYSEEDAKLHTVKLHSLLRLIKKLLV